MMNILYPQTTQSYPSPLDNIFLSLPHDPVNHHQTIAAKIFPIAVHWTGIPEIAAQGKHTTISAIQLHRIRQITLLCLQITLLCLYNIMELHVICYRLIICPSSLAWIPALACYPYVYLSLFPSMIDNKTKQNN